ncbi:MAG: thioredoxin family protein [Patescibacteria group bacterium]
MIKNFNWAKKIYADRFKRYLIVILIIIGLILIIKGQESVTQTANGLEFHFFYHPNCPHCKEQKPFNEKLMEKFPEVKFIYHDVTKPEESSFIIEFTKKANISMQNMGVPITFFGEYYFIGFDTAATTGAEIESALEAYVSGQTKQPAEIQKAEEKKNITLPFFGQINVLDYSLPMLAMILGLVDGFNPCAMWVLVYLISLVVAIGDRKKVWLIVGSFVLASGILYFLFMTAWLNVFLLMGYIRPLTIIIGLGALYAGAAGIQDYVKTKDQEVCKVGDIESKQKTMSRIERIVHSPITIATILGIVGLAFVVNSIEFVCSSAIPAIFTYVLSISNLSASGYYGYILLYDFFFMLDDLIIFGLAAFAVNTTLGSKYAKYCKLIGGVILLILGLMLTFAPHLLR